MLILTQLIVFDCLCELFLIICGNILLIKKRRILFEPWNQLLVDRIYRKRDVVISIPTGIGTRMRTTTRKFQILRILENLRCSFIREFNLG